MANSYGSSLDITVMINILQQIIKILQKKMLKVRNLIGAIHFLQICEAFVPDISSIGKWGGQLKATTREIRNFMIVELWVTKKDILIS